MPDYLEGANNCRLNCQRLEATARIILNDSNGTDSFALFLYHIAYEEIAKGIFCLFVHRGWVPEEFINRVFRDHRTKIFLFEEIFRSFSVNNGYASLGGKPLGSKSFDEFINEHKSSIAKHREITNDFLYVGKNNVWKIPEFDITDIKEREKEILEKINALDIIYEMIRTKLDERSTVMDNFKFYENGEGRFTIQYDTI